MELNYRAIQSSLESEDHTRKWFPLLVKHKEIISTRQLAIEVAEKSSLTPGDVINSVDGIFGSMARYLKGGYSVRLDGLGTFTLIAKSNGNGVNTPEEVNASQIKTLRVRFTPTYTRNSFNGTTRAMFSDVKFVRIDKPESTSNDDGGQGGSGSGDPNA